MCVCVCVGGGGGRRECAKPVNRNICTFSTISGQTASVFFHGASDPQKP